MNLNELVKKRQQLPPRMLFYSIAGWGKTTLASSMPSPIFLDIEDGLMGIDVPSFPVIDNYDSFEEYLRILIKEDHEYKTVVLDSTSSLEKLIWAKVCKDNNKPNIESFGYARGYTFAMTYWEKIIDGMEHLRKKGVAPVILAHSEVRTFNSPVVDPYDRYVLKLHRHPANRLTEWCDNIFFGNHRVLVKKGDDGFKQNNKGIGQGERVIYTEERPAFLAKSRMNLPFEIDIPKVDGWAEIAKHINTTTETQEN